MTSKPKPDSPDTRIDSKQRSKQADQPRELLVITDDDPVRSFSPRELDELRQRMLDLQSRSTGQAQLAAMRMVTLIDHHERALDQTENIRQALSGDADLEGLERKVEDVRDELKAELDREVDDSLSEAFDVDEQLKQLSSSQLIEVKRVALEWYSERLAEIRKEVNEQLDRIDTWRKDAAKALEAIDPDL